MISKLANFLIVASVLTSQATALPFQGSKINARVRRADNRAKVSTGLLKRFLQAGGISITVLNQAKAIAVFPVVAKVRTMWGGKTKGQGVISRRTELGWTAPAFFEISKGSESGIGSSESTIILVFTGDAAVNGLSHGKINFGKNGGTPPVLIPPGGNPPNHTSNRNILYYEFVDGISIDPIIDDASVKPNNTDNKAVYGGLNAKDVLFLKKKLALARLEVADGAVAFTRNLNELSPNINTPKMGDFPDAGYEHNLSRSLEEIKNHMKDYLRSQSIGYREEPTDNGIVITAFVDLIARGRRYRRAAFLIRIVPMKQESTCAVSLKWLIQSQGFRENDWVMTEEDKKDYPKQYVEAIDVEIKRLRNP